MIRQFIYMIFLLNILGMDQLRADPRRSTYGPTPSSPSVRNLKETKREFDSLKALIEMELSRNCKTRSNKDMLKRYIIQSNKLKAHPALDPQFIDFLEGATPKLEALIKSTECDLFPIAVTYNQCTNMMAKEFLAFNNSPELGTVYIDPRTNKGWSITATPESLKQKGYKDRIITCVVKNVGHNRVKIFFDDKQIHRVERWEGVSGEGCVDKEEMQNIFNLKAVDSTEKLEKHLKTRLEMANSHFDHSVTVSETPHAKYFDQAAVILRGCYDYLSDASRIKYNELAMKSEHYTCQKQNEKLVQGGKCETLLTPLPPAPPPALREGQ